MKQTKYALYNYSEYSYINSFNKKDYTLTKLVEDALIFTDFFEILKLQTQLKSKLDWYPFIVIVDGYNTKKDWAWDRYHGLKDSNKDKKEWYIWIEGYVVTGMSATASLVNHQPIIADSFNEAMRLLLEISPNDRMRYYKKDDHWIHWGCSVFDNEAEARKNFG